MYHIGFSASNAYIPYVAVTITSIVIYIYITKETVVHLK